MNKYFVIYGNHANTYRLYFAETPQTVERLLSCGAERITLKEARGLIKEEKERRKYGHGGLASVDIDSAEYIHWFTV